MVQWLMIKWLCFMFVFTCYVFNLLLCVFKLFYYLF